MSAAIEIRGLRKRFGRHLALDGIDLTVPPASIFGFLGPNGAGKTTTLRILTSLVFPDEGEVRVLGAPVRRGSSAQPRLGALVDRPAFYGYLSGLDNLMVFARARGLGPDDARAALDLVGLRGFAKRQAGTYSTGMRQQLGIAVALLGHPPVLVLDEPTHALDPEGTAEIRQLITELARNGTTVLLATHLLHEAATICTDLALITNGRIRASGPKAEFTSSEALIVGFESRGALEPATQVLTAEGLTCRRVDETHLSLPPATSGESVARLLASVELFPSELVRTQQSLEHTYLDVVRGAEE